MGWGLWVGDNGVWLMGWGFGHCCRCSLIEREFRVYVYRLRIRGCKGRLRVRGLGVWVWSLGFEFKGLGIGSLVHAPGFIQA